MSSWSVRRAASPPWWARTGQQLDGVLPPTAGTEARWETSYKNEEVGQIIGWSLEKYGLVVSCCQHQKQVQNTFILDWFRAKDGQEYEISMTNGTWQPKRKGMLYNALLQCWRWYNFHLAPCCAVEKNHWQRKCLFWLFCLSNITTFFAKRDVPLIEIPLPQLATPCCRWPSAARCPGGYIATSNQLNLTYAMDLDTRNYLLASTHYLIQRGTSQTWKNRTYTGIIINEQSSFGSLEINKPL